MLTEASDKKIAQAKKVLAKLTASQRQQISMPKRMRPHGQCDAPQHREAPLAAPRPVLVVAPKLWPARRRSSETHTFAMAMDRARGTAPA